MGNLLASWQQFRGGKRSREDVGQFERALESELFALHRDLRDGTYRRGGYTGFYITDPKLRHIHKAEIRDRIVHHAVYRVLYPIFNPTFIHDSYSCRLDKGTHRAVKRLESFTRKVSRNYTQPCWALKCDIRKFFDSVDHEILTTLLEKRIDDERVRDLLKEIVGSYETPSIWPAPNRERERESTLALGAKGIPIGNLTSQLFANIYMDPFDQFVKHELKERYYLRYTDDFVILGNSRAELEALLPRIRKFLVEHLRLELHPKKVSLRKLGQGIDFLGYVVLPHHTVLRTKTKRRMLRRVTQENLPSYLGLLQHANAHRLTENLKSKFPEET